ncbi:E3 SUMO-protein ligase ZBED1-like [Simochromis diagramma]|uniref:E3 SUMO-protein ligase ZBED1-like n=1 Tax=Simochromis diagramma TaxID=43689 RepID=UPI001A7E63AE|nr:E3 SUMO-protein ligase ZBED1-like [Simochromis diagramma]
MQCKLCLNSTVISAYKTSASNLKKKKHIERKHPSKIEQYNITVASTSRQRKTTATPNKLSANTQAKLPDLMLRAANKHVPQATVDMLVINFICEGLQPFAVVEQPSFKELVTTLQPQAKVISRPTVRARICEAADHMKMTLVAALDKVKFVATTTDCWSSEKLPWSHMPLEEESLERRSAAPACKRLRGSHTFDMLAGALDDIHCQYKIRGKVVRTTTDMWKALTKLDPLFGAQNDADEAEDEADPETIDLTDHIDYHEASAILDEDSGLEYQLPPHQRCACHLLNLVATSDAALAESMNETYKRLSRACFAKCQAIWNKTHLANEVVEDKCELQIIRLNATQWNSTYLAIERIIRIIDEKGENAIRSICEEFKVKMLSPAEVAFLREYCTTMKPLVKASNILQSESTSFMGWVLPVIQQLLFKLSKLETSSKTCVPLIRVLQNGLQKRFGAMMEDPELAAAAVLLPKFKTSWTDRADVTEAALTYIKQHLETTEHESEDQQRESSDEDEFFSRPISRRLQSAVELDDYLACATDTMELLHSFSDQSDVDFLKRCLDLYENLQQRKRRVLEVAMETVCVRLSKPKMDAVHTLINVISGVARLKSRENYARGERSNIGHHVEIFLIPQTDKEN